MSVSGTSDEDNETVNRGVVQAIEIDHDVLQAIERMIRQQVKKRIAPEWEFLYSDSPVITYQGCRLLRKLD